jgi:peptidyl-dipeptidase Dcp
MARRFAEVAPTMTRNHPFALALSPLTLLALVATAAPAAETTAAAEPAATATAASATAQSRPNPLLAEWQTPFGVPPFDRIQSSDYLPALRAGMAAQKQAIAAIVADPAAPTFANTLEALERSGATLDRVARVFFAVNSAHSDETTRETAKTVAPELAAHGDDLSLDPRLYARVKAVYDARASLGLTSEQLRLVEETHKDFVRAGVNLPAESQARLREINTELAGLGQQFQQNLLAELKAYELHVADRADLGSMPETLVLAAAEEARKRGHDAGWSFTLARPSVDPFLQYSPDRALRQQIFTAATRVGDNDDERDTKKLAIRTATLRAERAKLMGYGSHADFVLSDNMAETPARVYEFLDRIWPAALESAKAERTALAEAMAADGIAGPLQAWDWPYYVEKVRKARYDVDEEALRPYFSVDGVRDGFFQFAGKLFGLSFRPLPDLPRWHPQQQAFEVLEADGTHRGVLYLDFYARESKRSGAWANALRAQNKLDGPTAAITTTNFNYPPPAGGQPALLSYGEAEVVFHEIGHALHNLLSDVTYPSLAGSSVPRDFVEFPSQVLENWMAEPEVLRSFARHYKTGEPIPDELIAKLEASAKFNQGFKTVEYMAASYLDLAWHTLQGEAPADARAFEAAAMQKLGLIPEIVPRYRTTYFQHIFSGGYSSGYYGYLWAEVLDADAFGAFRETSLFDRATAARYRRLLAAGGSRPGMELYREFRGRDPKIEPLLERRGLLGAPQPPSAD